VFAILTPKSLRDCVAAASRERRCLLNIKVNCSPSVYKSYGSWIQALVSLLSLVRSHIKRTAAGGLEVLRQLRSIGWCVPSSVYQTLVTALVVLAQLDYGIATVAAVLSRLQSVINAVARFIASRPTQPSTLSDTGNEYMPKCGDTLRMGSKGRYGSFHLWINVWVAGKTAWSFVNTCHTWAL